MLASTKEMTEGTVIQASRGLAALQMGEVWRYRELLGFLVWRDIKVRYKQTALGVLWIVIQPVVTMVVFGLLFGRLLGVDSDGAPYPLFVYSALLPWQYFAGAMTRASSSVVDSAQLVTKVYFPRLIIPISAVLSGLVDFGVSFVVLLLIMAYFKVVPTLALLALPLFLGLAVVSALGFSLWLAALNVRYRDVRHLVPFLVQTWMYLTPVIYSSQLLPERLRPVLGMNPMTGVVEGFRWALLGDVMIHPRPPDLSLALAALISAIVLVSGALYFRFTERSFADIV